MSLARSCFFVCVCVDEGVLGGMLISTRLIYKDTLLLDIHFIDATMLITGCFVTLRFASHRNKLSSPLRTEANYWQRL